MLSIVIPCYNEADCIEKSVNEIIEVVHKKNLDSDGLELILVVERSTDLTLEIAQALKNTHSCVRILENDDKYGKGYSVRRGILETRGEYVLVIDADLPVNIEKYLPILIMLLSDEKTGAVYGTAFWDKVDIKKRKFMRVLASVILFILRKLLLRQSISDSQLGFKLYKGDLIRETVECLNIDNFMYELYITDLISKKGYIIDECAVSIDSFSEKSSVSFKSIITSLKTFIQYAFVDRRKIMQEGGSQYYEG